MTTNPMNQCQTKSSTIKGARSPELHVADLQSDCMPDPAILTPKERGKEFSRIMLRAIQRRHARQLQ